MIERRIKRAISGVLLLDKPAGVSSNGALQHVKRLYQAAKAGHTGSLDPIATGLLPICLGEATKFSQFLLDADKVYEAVISLGSTTTTGDAEGEVVSVRPVQVDTLQVLEVLQGFTGAIIQIPPMYSALKHQGRPLYDYARAGLDVERTPRTVHIHELALVNLVGARLSVKVKCSKGTYIRVLAEDIGNALGCGAHIVALRRMETGGFDISQAVTVSQLENMELAQRDALLLGPDCLVSHFPAIDLAGDSAYYWCQGQAVWKARVAASGLVRVYGEGRGFLGLGEITEDGKIAPRRVVV